MAFEDYGGAANTISDIAPQLPSVQHIVVRQANENVVTYWSANGINPNGSVPELTKLPNLICERAAIRKWGSNIGMIDLCISDAAIQ